MNTNKIDLIKAEVERLKRWNDNVRESTRHMTLQEEVFNRGKHSSYLEILNFIDSMQEECNITGIKSRHATGKLKECIDNQTEERLEQARKQLEENPQECMYARDNYTDEDRKILCDGCEEECEYNKKEDVWWLQELQDKLDSLSKEDFEKVWAKYHQKEEPVSEELDIAASEYLKQNYDIDNIYEEDDLSIRNTFKAGAQWQKEQFEKNRLKHCNSITNEQAELEQGFIDQHLDKYNRMPTFLDAIEYGIDYGKQQMMKEAVEGEITYGKSLAIPSLAYRLDRDGLDFGDKVKVLIIKED